MTHRQSPYTYLPHHRELAACHRRQNPLSLRRILSCVTIYDLSKVSRKLVAPIGLPENREFFWQAMFVHKHGCGVARCQQHLETGLQTPSFDGQLNAVNPAGHYDNREQKINLMGPLQDLKGLAAVMG